MHNAMGRLPQPAWRHSSAMDRGTPFFREQGSGPGVVCLHSNASSSSQWRLLSESLADRFHVIAVDGYDAGKSPPWPSAEPLSLKDEGRLLEPALERAGDRFHLVGHSYGAAVAIRTALMYPARVASVIVYEPTLFCLVAGADPQHSPAQGIWAAATDAAAAVDRGDAPAGARRFIDFWMGPGAYDAMPPPRQAAVAHSVRHVRRWRDTLTNEVMPLAQLQSLTMPVLCMHGEDSPESSLSVVRVLRDAVPHITVAPQAGMGHMGPITHAERVNAQVAEFLDRV
jgi:pimeloyl-ACP methyl ester carboxylesterase